MRPLTALVWLGGASAAGYAFLAFGFDADGSLSSTLVFLLVLLVLFGLHAVAFRAARGPVRRHPRRAVGMILGFAALFRLVMLFAGLPNGPPPAGGDSVANRLAADLSGQGPAYETFLLYDNDVWRYLWDGRVAAVGLDPYRWAPRQIEAAASEVFDSGESSDGLATVLDESSGRRSEDLWWEVYENVSFTAYRTVYPPLAMGLFRLAHDLAPGSVFLLKLLVALADFGTCWLVLRLLGHLGRGAQWGLLYAWNPLAIKEFAGSGHVDALMIVLLVLAIERSLAASDRLGFAAFGASVMAKLATLALAPWFFFRHRWSRGWPAIVTAVVIAIPVAGGLATMLESLAVFGREWVFNAGAWNLVRWLGERLGAETATAEAVAHALLKGLAVAVGLIVAWRVRHLPDRPWLFGGFLILAVLILGQAAVMPWYLLWALPLAVACGLRSWSVLIALSLFSYLIYPLHAEHAWWLWLEYGGFAVALACEWTLWPELRREWRTLVSGRSTEQVSEV